MPASALIQENLPRLALYGRVLGDETRLRILWALLDGERCVRELSAYLGMSDSAISHQLRELRLAGMVKNRREGKQIYYSYKSDRIREQVLHFSTQTV